MAIALLFMLIILVHVCVTDVTSYKISNSMCAIILVIGLTANIIDAADTGLKTSFLGLIVGFSAMLIIHLCTRIGAGDVKLMAAIGSVTGYNAILAIFYYSFLFSGLFAIAYLLYQRLLSRKLKCCNSSADITGLSDITAMNKRAEDKQPLTKLPMAPGITLASWYVMLPQIISSPIAIKTGFSHAIQ